MSLTQAVLLLRRPAALTVCIVALVPRLLWAQTASPEASQATSTKPTPFATTNQGGLTPEVVQSLLKRIEQLEAKEAARLNAEEKAHAAEFQELVTRIHQLESKVQALESGKVIPEIAVTPNPAPTNEELDQKIRIAERKSELAAEAAEARAKDAPKISAGPGGFSISSADTNFVLRLRGVFQLDSRTFFDESPLLQGNDGFLIRRARPIFEGTLYRDFDFAIVPDFAPPTPVLFDAYINYRYSQAFQLRAGKFKEPVGLEQLQSDTFLPFNERGLPSDLVSTRDVGLQLWGDFGDGRWNYAVGVFNGTGDGRVAGNSPTDDSPEFAGRIFLQPFKYASVPALQGWGFGVGGSFTQVSSNTAGLPNNTGGSLPGYWTAGQQQFFAYNPVIGTVFADGSHWRVQPQSTYYWGPFGLLGEYGVSYQDVLNSTTLRRASLNNTAWQVAAQWVLTGEAASFTGITPAHNFAPRSGGWGAWQLVARYGQLHIDDQAFQGFSNPATSAESASAWSVGLNWWLNRNLRVLTSFSYTMFNGGGTVNPAEPASLLPPGPVTANDELVFFTRLQIAF